MAIWIALLLELSVLMPAKAQAANEFSLAVAPNSAVTMGDASSTIAVTLTNSAASTDYIGYVKLSFDATYYYIGNNTPAPPGWELLATNNGAGQANAEFGLIVAGDPTYRIDPGESLTFNIVLTGPKSGNDYLPILSSAGDVTDYVSDICNNTSKATEARRIRTSTKFGQTGTCSASCSLGNIQDCFQRKALYSTMNASPSAVGPGGTITITYTVTNRSSGELFAVQPYALLVTGSESASANCGGTPAAVPSLYAGESATFSWTCTASGSGSLQFCDSAKNGTNTATSITACSDPVSVGDFTANLSLSPQQVVSGQNVLVTMTVTNNGTGALHGITPELFTFYSLSGSSTSTCTGPVPATISPLGGNGSSSPMTWICTVDSTQVGSTFRYSGVAKSGAAFSNPNPTYSNVGTVTAYSVAVDPDMSWYLNSSVTFTFRLRNTGVYPVYEVRIAPPATGNGFYFSSASGGCTSAWNVTPTTPVAPPTITEVQFTTDKGGVCPNCIPAGGGVCDFSITYASPTYPTPLSLPDVSANENSSTDYNFKVDVWDTLINTTSPPRASLGVIIKITKNGISVEAVPDAVAPGCFSEIIATVAPAPLTGNVTFLTTGGMISSMTTDTASGEAHASLKAPAPYDAAIPTAMVTATYQGIFSSTTVSFPNTTPCRNANRFRWQERIP